MNKTGNISVHRQNIHQWISDFGVHILAIVLSVLRSTDSDYTFGILKLFWYQRRALLIIHVRYCPCIYTNKGGYCIYHRSRQFLFVVLIPDKISTISKYIDHFTTYNDQLTITVNKKKISHRSFLPQCRQLSFIHWPELKVKQEFMHTRTNNTQIMKSIPVFVEQRIRFFPS